MSHSEFLCSRDDIDNNICLSRLRKFLYCCSNIYQSDNQLSKGNKNL